MLELLKTVLAATPLWVKLNGVKRLNEQTNVKSVNGVRRVNGVNGHVAVTRPRSRLPIGYPPTRKGFHCGLAVL